eukprot:3780945-Pleurochrysis_carterae.AAC.1
MRRGTYARLQPRLRRSSTGRFGFASGERRRSRLFALSGNARAWGPWPAAVWSCHLTRPWRSTRLVA